MQFGLKILFSISLFLLSNEALSATGVNSVIIADDAIELDETVFEYAVSLDFIISSTDDGEGGTTLSDVDYIGHEEVQSVTFTERESLSYSGSYAASATDYLDGGTDFRVYIGASITLENDTESNKTFDVYAIIYYGWVFDNPWYYAGKQSFTIEALSGSVEKNISLVYQLDRSYALESTFVVFSIIESGSRVGYGTSNQIYFSLGLEPTPTPTPRPRTKIAPDQIRDVFERFNTNWQLDIDLASAMILNVSPVYETLPSLSAHNHGDMVRGSTGPLYIQNVTEWAVVWPVQAGDLPIEISGEGIIQVTHTVEDATSHWVIGATDTSLSCDDHFVFWYTGDYHVWRPSHREDFPVIQIREYSTKEAYNARYTTAIVPTQRLVDGTFIFNTADETFEYELVASILPADYVGSTTTVVHNLDSTTLAFTCYDEDGYVAQAPVRIIDSNTVSVPDGIAHVAIANLPEHEVVSVADWNRWVEHYSGHRNIFATIIGTEYGAGVAPIAFQQDYMELAEYFIEDVTVAWKSLNWCSETPIEKKNLVVVVAASNSPEEAKRSATYVCDGVDDEDEITYAFNSLVSTGGEIRLLEGDYYIGADIKFTPNSAAGGGEYRLVGTNKKTVIYRNFSATVPMLSCNRSFAALSNRKGALIIKDIIFDGSGLMDSFGKDSSNYPYGCINIAYSSSSAGSPECTLSLDGVTIQNIGNVGYNVGVRSNADISIRDSRITGAVNLYADLSIRDSHISGSVNLYNDPSIYIVSTDFDLVGSVVTENYCLYGIAHGNITKCNFSSGYGGVNLDSSDLKIEDCAFTGLEIAIHTDNSVETTIEDCVFTSCDAGVFGYEPSAVIGCRFRNISGRAIEFKVVSPTYDSEVREGVLVKDNVFMNIGDDVFCSDLGEIGYYYASAPAQAPVIFSNNTATNVGGDMFNADGGIFHETIIVKDNTAINIAGQFFSMNFNTLVWDPPLWSNYYIDGNTIYTTVTDEAVIDLYMVGWIGSKPIPSVIISTNNSFHGTYSSMYRYIAGDILITNNDFDNGD